MNEIFEKLGIYDFVAVLLSGSCIMTATLWLNERIWKYELPSLKEGKKTFVFFICSYLVGVCMQEITSYIYKAIDKNNKVLSIAYGAEESEKVSHYSLTEYEREKVKKNAKQYLKETKTDLELEEIYNCCKFYLIKQGKGIEQMDKQQAIYGFSRSVGGYFCVMGIVGGYFTQEKRIFLILLVIGIVMIYRCVRFARMRYVSIMRNFCYTYEEQNSFHFGA